jgi:hypothetical protein
MLTKLTFRYLVSVLLHHFADLVGAFHAFFVDGPSAVSALLHQRFFQTLTSQPDLFGFEPQFLHLSFQHRDLVGFDLSSRLSESFGFFGGGTYIEY